jgi:hypothetical protein
VAQVVAIVPDCAADVHVLRIVLLRHELGGGDVVVDGEEEGELQVGGRSRNKRAILVE